ncbi:MAG: tetratricopeptide repeat protein, partial [Alphaproteobacteria bacterium]
MAVAKNKKSPFDAALERQQHGDLEGAEAGFRAALEDEPDNPDALILLGALLHKTKRAGEAVGLIEAAIAAAAAKKRKADPSWRIVLAFAKSDSGDIEGALDEIDSQLKKAPGTADLLFLRGGILQRLGRSEEAIEDYQTFLAKSPGNAQGLNNLGVSQRSAGRLGDAYQSFAKAFEIKPNYAQAALNAGQLLGDMGQREGATAMLRRAHALEPDNRIAELALVDALQVGEQAEEAERLAEKILARDPQDVRAMIQLGNVQVALGKSKRAVELARKAHALEPKMPGVLSLLAETDRESDSESLLAKIEDLLSGDGQHGFRQRIALNFSAARLCEKLNRHEQAFDHYVAGNAGRHDQLERLDKAYDRARFEDAVDRQIAAFGASRLKGTAGNPSELPVFIVGMPRSGTSLTEQILASHPRAAGAGELGEIGQIIRWLRSRYGFPEKLPEERLKEAAKGYLT